MRTMQLLVDAELLRLLDEEAKRQSTDRSKLMREALRRYLRRLQQQRDDEAYIAAYRKKPLDKKELAEWQSVQAWPED